MNLLNLSADEKLAFFLNLYNAMVIHAVIRVGHPGGMIDRRAFFSEFQYLVGGYSYSLSGLKDGILRSNRRAPLSLMRPFPGGDRRLEVNTPPLLLIFLQLLLQLYNCIPFILNIYGVLVIRSFDGNDGINLSILLNTFTFIFSLSFY